MKLLVIDDKKWHANFLQSVYPKELEVEILNSYMGIKRDLSEMKDVDIILLEPECLKHQHLAEAFKVKLKTWFPEIPVVIYSRFVSSFVSLFCHIKKGVHYSEHIHKKESAIDVRNVIRAEINKRKVEKHVKGRLDFKRKESNVFQHWLATEVETMDEDFYGIRFKEDDLVRSVCIILPFTPEPGDLISTFGNIFSQPIAIYRNGEKIA